jgi:hypothetical protein
MYTITPLRVLAVLLVYAALLVLIRAYKKKIDRDEKETFITIALGWSVPVFIGNYLCYKIGVMSFLPWINNIIHCFIWIGICLSWLYLAIREKQPMWVQFLLMAVFSFIVKFVERYLFGTWEHPHFFYVFKGNAAYIIGWSLFDGVYPLVTMSGLKLLAWIKFIRKLMKIFFWFKRLLPGHILP